VLVNSGTIKKTVTDHRGRLREVSCPGSRFRVWCARTSAEVGVASLNAAAAARKRGGTTPRGRIPSLDLRAGVDLEAAAPAAAQEPQDAKKKKKKEEEEDATFTVSDLGPCLLNTYDKKEDPDELLGRVGTSPVCTVDLYIENEQIQSTRRRTRTPADTFMHAAKYVTLLTLPCLYLVYPGCACVCVSVVVALVQ